MSRPSAGPLPLRLSIVIEWKNQAFAADARAAAMLERLAEQWPPIARAGAVAGVPFDPCCELLPVVDCAAARSHLHALIGSRFDGDPGRFSVRILDGEGLAYYQLKHRGALASRGDLLIFLDSDVIPDAGWLEALLGAAVQPDIAMVCGDTYIQPDGLMGRTFSAIWFSLPSARRGGLERDVKCAANNLACRADFYRDHPFIDVPGANRGVLPEMRRGLAAAGILMYRCPSARVSHPTPNGLGHFLTHALGRGRNLYFRARQDDDPTGLPVRVWRKLSAAAGRLLRNRRAAGLRAWELPAALALVLSYYALLGLGTLLTWLAPAAMRVRFQY